MNYLKYTAYVYLLAAVFFIYDGFVQYSRNEPNAWLSFLIAGLAIFMFFFRKRFSSKFENRNRKPNP